MTVPRLRGVRGPRETSVVRGTSVPVRRLRTRVDSQRVRVLRGSPRCASAPRVLEGRSLVVGEEGRTVGHLGSEPVTVTYGRGRDKYVHRKVQLGFYLL